MSRNSRTLHLEHLEQRELLSVNGSSDLLALTGYYSSESASIAGPTAEEQEMLELINRMRIDPQGELNRLIKSLSPLEAWDSRVTQAIRAFSYPRAGNLTSEWAALQACAPLAWDLSLYVVATNHSFRMIQADEQSHQLTGEAPLIERIVDAGFDPAMKYDEAEGEYFAVASENIYAYGRDASGDFSAASYTHAAFAIDWGVPSHSHRDNIMNPEFTHVGISMLIETNPATDVGTYITTVDFSAAQSSADQDGAYLLGVIFDDYNSSGYYDAGEGISDVQITVSKLDSSLNSSGSSSEELEPYVFSPYQAGGYQIFLENGNYSISVSGPNFSGNITKYVSIQGENVKIDFTPQECSNTVPILDLNGSLEGIHYGAQFLENGSTVSLLSSEATLRDSDSSYLSHAIITLENRPDGGNEFLCVNTNGTGLSSTYDSSSGVLLIFGNASLNDYLSVLKTVEYGNASTKAELSDRVVSFVVSDGINQSEVANSTVLVIQQTLETLTVAEVQIEEGDQGTREMVFHFELSDIPRCEVLVEYVFVDETAIQGTHYFAEGGTLQIQADQKTASVVVSVPGDYLPGEDLTFYLQIKRIYGAECSETMIRGTIWDDDTPKELGSRRSWASENLDLTDGRRRLYSFQPEKSGVIFWEAVLAEGNRTDFVMEIYKGTHEGDVLLQAFEHNGRERIAWEVEKGETYTVLIRGENVVLDSLKMVLASFSEKESSSENGKKSLEIQLDPQNNDVLAIDALNDVIQYNGIDLPYRFSDYADIGFQDVSPYHVLQFIVPNQQQNGFDVNPDDVWIPDSGGEDSGGTDVNIDLDDFQHIEYVVSNSENVVRIWGTVGDDKFHFEDGVAQFTTSTGKVFTIRNGKVFDIQGNGGIDRAYIFDTKYNDYVRFDSATANFLGGGDTGYDISVSDFTVVDVSSLYGGLDTVYIVNDNDSSAYLNERIIRRVEFDSIRNVDRTYYARNMNEAVLSSTETTDSTVYLEGGLVENQIYITPGQLISTNAFGTYNHVIYGNAKVEWVESLRSGLPTIFYNSPAEVDDPYWIDATEQATLFVPSDANGPTIEWTASLAAFRNFYYNGVKKDVESLTPSDMLALLLEIAQNESVQESVIPDVLENLEVLEILEDDWDLPLLPQDEPEPITSVSATVRIENNPTTEWYRISVRSLSLADLALIYGDF